MSNLDTVEMKALRSAYDAIKSTLFSGEYGIDGEILETALELVDLTLKRPEIVVVVWKDGTSKSVLAESAWEYEADADYLTTVRRDRFNEVLADPVDQASKEGVKCV